MHKTVQNYLYQYFYKYITSFTLVVFLASCGDVNTNIKTSYAPTEEELAKADYGALPSDYKELIKDYISDTLLDPESVRFYNFSIPEKDWLSSFSNDFSLRYKKYFGWLVCVDVNAKNSYGGYTGRKTNYILLKDNRVVYSQTTYKRDIAYGAWKYFIECSYE